MNNEERQYDRFRSVTAEQLESSAREAFQAALDKLKPAPLIPDGYFTTQQWSVKLGKAESTLRNNFRRLIAAGMAERLDVFGARAPVYRLK